MGKLQLLVTLDEEVVIGSVHSEDVQKENATIRAMEMMALEIAVALVRARKHTSDEHKGGQNGE